MTPPGNGSNNPRDQVLVATAKGFAASLVGIAHLPEHEIHRIVTAAPELEQAAVVLMRRLRAVRDDGDSVPLLTKRNLAAGKPEQLH